MQKHFHIASWLYSERKDDPALREVMLLLLENGYGIEDYSRVIWVLSFHKAEVEAMRESDERWGFIRRWRLKICWKRAERSLARQGITGANLIEALWAVNIRLIREGGGAIIY